MDSFQALQIRDDFRESHLEFHGIRILFQPIHACPADNRKNCDSEAERRSIKRVTPGQLEAWGIISKVRGKWIASNAYALLTGNPLFAIRLKCGVFKGDDKDVFLDRREFRRQCAGADRQGTGINPRENQHGVLLLKARIAMTVMSCRLTKCGSWLSTLSHIEHISSSAQRFDAPPDDGQYLSVDR